MSEYLTRQEDIHYYRIYSPSYSLPQQTAAVHRFELADGVDPMQLAAYSSFMEGAAGVPGGGYSVTLPPFINGNPQEDNKEAVPDAQKLGLLSVKYVVSEFPLDNSQLELLARFGETRVYKNPFVYPRAWVQNPGAALGENITPAAGWSAEPNQIEVQASGPGLVVLSEISYPGWEVSIDGVPGRVITAGGLLRGVQILEGEHQVIFSFRPRLFYLGVVLFGMAWVGIILASLQWRKADG
ncbi:MAG: hypothetical protein IH586_20730 [Anaerolineaceae bacterium]|nr:hypothetical protein [Anaerolineaceae bacterium]